MKKTHNAITTVAVIIVILIIAAGYIDHDFKTYHELNTKKNILSDISDNGKIIELYEQPDYFIVMSVAPEKPRNIKLQYFERKILWYYRTSFTSPVYDQDSFYKDVSWQYGTKNGLGMYLVVQYGILEKTEAFVKVTYDDDTEKTIKPDKDGYFFKVEELSAKSFLYSPETYVKWAKVYDEKGELLETQMHWTDNRGAINSEGISESVHQLLRQDNKGLQTKQGDTSNEIRC